MYVYVLLIFHVLLLVVSEYERSSVRCWKPAVGLIMTRFRKRLFLTEWWRRWVWIFHGISSLSLHINPSYFNLFLEKREANGIASLHCRHSVIAASWWYSVTWLRISHSRTSSLLAAQVCIEYVHTLSCAHLTTPTKDKLNFFTRTYPHVFPYNYQPDPTAKKATIIIHKYTHVCITLNCTIF